MKIAYSGHKIVVGKTLRQLLVWYFIALAFTYPYGLEISSDNFIRFPDFVAMAISGFGITAWLMLGKSQLKLKPFLPILPFFLMEIIFPLIGVIYYQSLSAAFSSARVLLLYLPVIVCPFFLNVKSAYQLDFKLEKLFKVVILANFFYCIVQLAVSIGILPDFLLITNGLAPWAADAHFNQVSGFRISGFFVNVSALAAFGIITMSYFLAKFQVTKKGQYLVYFMISLLLIMLSTSRSGYVAAILIILVSLVTSGIKKSLKLSVVIAASCLVLVLILNSYLDIDYGVFFSRFVRIQENGLEQDYSWRTRVQVAWPSVLARLGRYPWGTFIPSFKLFGVIDSGYLTYFAQGKWIFIGGFISSFLGILLTSFRTKNASKKWSVIFLRYLLIYISTAMVVNNPMRSPFVIFALLYGLWFLSIEKNPIAKRLHYK